jgi:hypothetical protein
MQYSATRGFFGDLGRIRRNQKLKLEPKVAAVYVGKGLLVEDKKEAPSSLALEAKHRGGGSYSIMRGDEELAEKLTKEQAEAFNKADAAAKETLLAGLVKAEA